MGNLLIIAGFHRSGTSLTARILHQAGLFLGNELLGANPSNPYGHYEDREILDLHDRLLADEGESWQITKPLSGKVAADRRSRLREWLRSRSEQVDWWGFKEPRVCSFLPMWKREHPQARVLVVYRHYSECLQSLHHRASKALLKQPNSPMGHGRFWEVPDLALRMWLCANQELLRFARQYPEDTLAVSLDMLKEGFPLVEALNQQWETNLLAEVESDAYDPQATHVVETKTPLSDSSLAAPLQETWEALQNLSQHTASQSNWNHPRTKMYSDAFYSPTDVDSLRMENDRLARENEHLRHLDQEKMDAIQAKADRVLDRHRARWEELRSELTEKARRSREELLAMNQKRQDLERRLIESQQQTSQLTQRLRDRQQELKEERSRQQSLETTLQGTRNDLEWILEHLKASPLRWFFTRRSRFQKIDQRYSNQPSPSESGP